MSTPVNATALTELDNPTHFLVGRSSDGLYGKVTFADPASVAEDAEIAQEAAALLAGVRAFGAGLGGDDTAAFSAAALAATAVDNIDSPWSAIPHALVCQVLVPAGYYTLSSLVDTDGRDVTWELDPAAIITGIEYINGTVSRPGRVTKRFTPGTLDQGTGLGVAIGGDYDDKPPAVSGFTDTQQAAEYAQHDAVAIVAAAYSAPAIIDAASATYTATTATIPAPGADAVKRLRAGALIYTKHSPKCAGFLESWNADGTVLTVAEWREDDGSSAVTPANGTGLQIGVKKIYGLNSVTVLTTTGFATQAIGHEHSMRNTMGDSTADIDDPTNRAWGILSAAAAEGTAGYFKSQAAFIARGSWYYGYYADNQDTGYAYRSSVAGGKTSFFSRSHFDNTLLLATDTTDKQRYAISGRGDVTHGDPTVAAASGRYIQFATAGLGASYDVKLAAIGGAAGAGQGILGAYAKQIGLNTLTPDASACLDISNSGLGFLPPRMSSATRDAIASPTNGLVIWNVTTSKLQVRAAGVWTDLH
jgi:hypothetical protein